MNRRLNLISKRKTRHLLACITDLTKSYGNYRMSNDMKTALIAMVGAVVGGLIVALGNYVVTMRESEIKMIEIAIGILAAKPDQNIKPARAWAVDVLEHYSSEVPLTADVRVALLENPLPVQPTGTGAFGDGPIGGGPIGPQ